MRVAVTAFAFPGVVALSVAAAIVTGETAQGAAFVAIWLGPVAIFSALAGRAWTLSLPLTWGALYLVIIRLVDLLSGACSVCGEDESWGNYPYFFAILEILPITAAVLVGLTVGWVIRALRRGG